MKKILSVLLVLALICVLFTGCDWQEIGSMLGGIGHDLILGIKDGFENGATYPTLPSLNLDDFNPLAPSTTKPTQPTVQAPEIPEGSNFQVHYIDVGQADSILIICDGQAMLIDGGNNADGATVLRYLQQAGVTELALMVGSHGHEDHIGGLDTVLNYYMCKELW